jgi:hypothetical protein
MEMFPVAFGHLRRKNPPEKHLDLKINCSGFSGFSGGFKPPEKRVGKKIK